MGSEISDDFFEKSKVGQIIPPLTKRAVIKEFFMTWGRGGELHPIFGDSRLEEVASQAAAQAEAKEMDTIHFISMLPGNQALEFLSQMITNWLPSPRGWLFGGQLNAKMVRPISPNELITCHGRVAQKIENDQKCLVCEVWIEKETGERAVAGEATIRF